MTIGEMHVWFRQYAQQMGMQNVRAILPEQIDNLINTSTLDIIDEVINKNVGTTNDRIITDNAKLASVNALRTLYRVKTITSGTNGFSLTGPKLTFTSAAIGKHLYIVDLAISYTKSGGGNISGANLFPVRIIDEAYLADVMNDWVLAPRVRTPVAVIYGAATDSDTTNDTDHDVQFDIYVSTTGTLPNSLEPYSIKCSYIKRPAEVSYATDIGGADVNSDLPLQLQIPMLKHAVDLYRASISGSLFATQQQNENQQREMVRNNARPDNEGYQS